MQLRFLGQTYSTSDNSIETVAIPQTARFMGRSYIMRRPVSKPQLKSTLGLKKYRGVTYDS